MFNVQKDQLFTLIKALTKAEKRNFKLYAKRFQSGGDSKFIRLFDILDKQTSYDEIQILKKLRHTEKRHLSNLKRHLYKQILVSLRLIHIQKNIDIQIREQLDFARILYGKGMYMQSLRLLERIMHTAQEHHQDILQLEILEFQKLIEARHITRSRKVKNKMEKLLEESSRRSYITQATGKLSNLNIQIHGYYILHGHIKDEKEAKTVREAFGTDLPALLPQENLTFFERANLYQSYLWYHYILLDFSNCCDYARQWVNLFNVHPKMKQKDPDLYMRGLYYLLTNLYYLRELEDFEYYLLQFDRFVSAEKKNFNANSRRIAFLYLNLSRLNQVFLSGSFENGLGLAKKILASLKKYETNTDIHRILLFYYKISCLYFACNNYEKALEYLNEIIHLKSSLLGEDFVNNARLLDLICHCELNHYDLAGYLILSLRRSFRNLAEVGKLQKATLDFIRQLISTPESEKKQAFRAFSKKVQKLSTELYEKKSFLYLDIPFWVDRHLK